MIAFSHSNDWLAVEILLVELGDDDHPGIPGLAGFSEKQWGF